MWDFTRSMLRFSWAMSLFGVQQMANLFAPSKASKAFDDVTRATEAELGNGLREAFRAGDSLQRGLVDVTFGAFTGQRTGPVYDGTQPSADPASQGGQATSAPSQPAAEGWGPMPGPGPAPSPAPAAPSIAEPDISPDYPYEPHYLDVLGSRMHYIQQGSG